MFVVAQQDLPTMRMTHIHVVYALHYLDARMEDAVVWIKMIQHLHLSQEHVAAPKDIPDHYVTSFNAGKYINFNKI